MSNQAASQTPLPLHVIFQLFEAVLLVRRSVHDTEARALTRGGAAEEAAVKQPDEPSSPAMDVAADGSRPLRVAIKRPRDDEANGGTAADTSTSPRASDAASHHQGMEAEAGVEATVGAAEELAGKAPLTEEEPAALTRSMRPRRAGGSPHLLSPPTCCLVASGVGSPTRLA
jgi:hypothetical protein